MPELPEVETVRNTLKRLILNKKIIDVDIRYENIIEYPTSNEFKKKARGKTICVGRRDVDKNSQRKSS